MLWFGASPRTATAMAAGLGFLLGLLTCFSILIVRQNVDSVTPKQQHVLYSGALNSPTTHVLYSGALNNSSVEFLKIPLQHPVSHHPGESAAICAIVIHEEAYLDEWVDYHYGLGFTAFYIYDNSPTNELRQWASEKGPHIFLKHDKEKNQMHSYLDCATTYGVKNKNTWIAFFDADEFLVLRRHRNVVDFLHEYAAEGALGINWFLFSTAGRLHYEPLPMTKRFMLRNQGVHKLIKSIVKLDDLNKKKRMGNPHNVPLKNGKKTVDTNGHDFDGPFNPNGPTDVAVLHHYHFKSRKEYIFKKMRGCSDKGCPDLNWTEAEALADKRIRMRDGGNNDTIDDSAWQLLKELVPKYQVFDMYEGWR